MSERERLLDHEYDGITEYDNPTPGWWHAIFIGSILFSFVYFAFYQWSPLATNMYQAHANAEVRVLRQKFGEIGELAADEQTIIDYMGQEDWMAYAASVYKGNCVSCHGSQGEGLVGPNLTDNAYKNVTSLTDIHKVLVEGANNGAMPAWGTRLHPNELVLLSSYVASMRGGNLTGPRPPEGDQIPAWPTGGGS